MATSFGLAPRDAHEESDLALPRRLERVSLAAVGVPKKDGTLFPGHLWGKGMKKKHGPYPFKTWTKTTLLKRFAARQLESCQLNQAVSSGISGLGTEVRPSKWASTLSSAPLRKGTNGSWPLVVVGELWLWPVIPEICKTFVDIHCYHCDFVFCCLIIPEEAWDFI